MGEFNLDNYNWWNPFTQIKSFLKYPVIIERAEGPYLYDIRNRKYIDMSSSMWNVSLGHNNRELIDAIAGQYKKLDFVSPFRASNQAAVDYTDKLAQIYPGKLEKTFLTCNGSDSVEAGIKMARQYWKMKNSGKYKIISLKHAYHGVSYGAMCCSGFDEDKSFFGPLLDGFIQIPKPDCYRCPFDREFPGCGLVCAGALEEVIVKEGADTVALFIIEPVMGMGGVIVPPGDYLKQVQEICRKHNVLFMVDEVTTGFGRTGKMFASELMGLSPDMMALGKAMSNGYFPIGATAVTRDIWDAFIGDESVQFNHGSTYFGHPVGCAAGLKYIELIEKNDILARVERLGAFFAGKLEALKEHPMVGDVRSIGLMFAIEFVKDKATREPIDSEKMKKLIMVCYSQGLWAHFTGNRIIIFPPFIVDEALLETVYQTLLRSIRGVEKR